MIEKYTQRSGAGWRRWLWLLLLCLVISLLLAGLKYRQISEAIAFAESFPERSETVNAVTVSAQNWRDTYRTIAEVRSPQLVETRNEVEGMIKGIGFAGGDNVLSGQLLLELDSSEEKAQLRALGAQLELANLQLKRTQELRRKSLASKDDLDRAQADKNVLAANAAALQARISKKILRAPFDARTDLHNFQVGQYLAPNTLITTLSGLQADYWVDFQLPQDITTLEIGDQVTLSSRSLLAEPIEAQVISADSRIDPLSRSRSYRALLQNAPPALRPGAVLDVSVGLQQKENIFRLPASAVRADLQGDYVYVLKSAENGADAAYRAERRPVIKGPAIASEIIILGGIESGELIATLGAFKLTDGMLANIAKTEAGEVNEQAL